MSNPPRFKKPPQIMPTLSAEQIHAYEPSPELLDKALDLSSVRQGLAARRPQIPRTPNVDAY